MASPARTVPSSIARQRTRIQPAPRRNPRNASARNRTSRYTYADARYQHANRHHFRSHYAALSFSWGWGAWGYYSYPYRYCWGFPGSWYGHHWGYWNSGYPYCGTWWWPRRCYALGSWAGFGFYGAYSYSYPAPSVVTYETVAGATPSEVTVGEEPLPEEEELTELQKLAKKHIELGDFYFKAGRFDEAAESYMRALAYVPEDGSLHFVIGDALFASGDYHYAAFMIGKGLELDRELATAETDKRTFYGDPKLFDEQIEKLRKYVADKPYDASALLVLGYNLRFSGKPDEAKVTFENVLDIDAANRPATVFLEALRPPAPTSASR